MTKRSVLHITASIFDPLGLLAPFVIKLKMLFRRLCQNQSWWDDNLHYGNGNPYSGSLNILNKLPFLDVFSRWIEDQLRFKFMALVMALILHMLLFCTWGQFSMKRMLKNHCCQDKGHPFEEIIYTSTRATKCFNFSQTQQYCATTSAEPYLWVDSTTVLYWTATTKFGNITYSTGLKKSDNLHAERVGDIV